MLGPRLFPWTERLLWVDAKLRLGATDPRDFLDKTTDRHGVCASFVGLPYHSNSRPAGVPPSLRARAARLDGAGAPGTARRR